MKKSSKIILASVLAVGVAGGAFAFGSHHYFSSMTMQEKSDMFNDHVSRKLDLNTQQELELEALSGHIAEVMQQVRDNRQMRQELLDDLITDGPMDQAALLQRISHKTDMVKQKAPEMVALIAGFVDSLDADQKQQLKDLIKKRRGHSFGHRFGRHGDHQQWIDG